MKDIKYPGANGIRPKLLLHIVEQISIPFATVFNLSLEEGVIQLEGNEIILKRFEKLVRKQ